MQPPTIDTTPLRLREPLLHGILLVAILAIMFPAVFYRGEVITAADLLFSLPPWDQHKPPGWERPQNPLMADVISVFHPMFVLARTALARGEWPLWNPAECAGIPLMANCQSAVFYPPRLLHLLPDIPFATSLYVLLKLWLCGMTAYLCARGMRLRPASARFLSLAWMLCTYNQFWACWPLPDVSAWLPVVFLGVELACAGAYRRAVAAIAAGGALILLAGHPETAFAMCFNAGVYFVLRMLLEWRRGAFWGRAAAACAVGWTAALLVSAVQWLPFVEYLLNSYTFSHREFGSFTSELLPNTSVGLFVPRFYGAEAHYNFWGDQDGNRYAIYPGILIWIAAALLFAQRKELGGRKRPLIALAIAAAAAILSAFNAPGLSLLHQLPGFESLRQNYHIGFGLFAVAVLGATGLDGWLSRPRRLRELAWTAVPLVPACALVYAALQFYARIIEAYEVSGLVWRQVTTIAAVAVLGLLLLAAHTVRPRPRLIGTLMAALLAADLIAAGWRINPALPAQYAYPDTELFRYLRAQGEPLRIEPGGALGAPGVCAGFGVQEWMGYDGLYPERIIHFARTLNTDLWNSMEPVCNIRFYLRHPEMEDGVFRRPAFAFDDADIFRFVHEIEGVSVYENLRAQPRAFLVSAVREIADVAALFDVMRSKDYDPKREVVTDRAPKGSPLPAAVGLDSPGSVSVESYGPTVVRLRAEADRDCALVLADGFFPGWHAYIDGRRTEVFPAYYAFRGILLPAGAHTVEFRYTPLSFRIGLALSVLTLLAGLAVSPVLLRKPRQAPS